MLIWGRWHYNTKCELWGKLQNNPSSQFFIWRRSRTRQKSLLNLQPMPSFKRVCCNIHIYRVFWNNKIILTRITIETILKCRSSGRDSDRNQSLVKIRPGDFASLRLFVSRKKKSTGSFSQLHVDRFLETWTKESPSFSKTLFNIYLSWLMKFLSKES